MDRKYKQADLERMGIEELRSISKMAHKKFNELLVTGLSEEDAIYFELLTGACDDIILEREIKANEEAEREYEIVNS